MSNDQTSRSARRLATTIAIPVALLTGFGVFQLLKPGFVAPEEPKPSASAVRPLSTAPVAMPALALDAHQAEVCRAILAKLPAGVREAARRPVTEGPEQNAAYGDPAVTLACGTPAAVYGPEEFVYPLNGVCWYSKTWADGTIWTTVDREIPVSVKVPAGYEQPGQWVIPFSASIAAAQPELAKVPTGCHAQ